VKNLATEINCDTAVVETGKVQLSSDRLYMVDTPSGRIPAAKSVSCLVEPLPGDTVLISQSASGKSYILSILEREDDRRVDLVFNGDVDLKTKDGRLRLAAQKGLDLVSAGETAMVSGELSINSLQAEINIQRLSFFSTFLHGQIQRIKLIGQSCDSVFERVSQNVKRCFRRVEEIEQLNAGQLDYKVKKLMSLRGKYSILTAQEDVRIDGDKILMG
jgi:hypothetical protein